MAGVRVTQTRSSIGTKPKQRGTLRALGLGRIGQSNTLPDDAVTRGAVAKVAHLVQVEEVSAAGVPRPRRPRPAAPPRALRRSRRPGVSE